jgi:hypothetical protein
VATTDGGARTDRSGWLPLPTAVDSIALAAPGYLPWDGKVGADSTLRLEPRERGRFHGVRVAIDPGTPGAAAAAPSAWSAPETAHRAGVWLAERLRAAGALPLVVRARGEPAADLLRVQRATGHEADWYLRIEPGAAAAVRFAPSSGAGERLAREIAAALERESGLRPAVASEASFVLLQTACPAVVVVLPASQLGDALRTRGLVAALGCGLRRVLDPESAALPPLVGRAPAGALVVLDGGEIAAARADGGFRFEALAPGTHCVRLLAPEPRPPVCAVAAGDTLRIDLTAGAQ